MDKIRKGGFDFNEKHIYLDGYLKSNLDLLIEAVNKKWDGIFYICGYEGDGKTTMGAQIMAYLDKDFNIDNCVFTPKQFAKAVEQAKPKTAILFDEAYLTFTNMSFFKEATRKIISLLTMIRKKQLFICIVAPTFFDINKYLVIHRSRFMIRVYAEGLERGRFLFYSRAKKHILFIKGKKEHNFNVVKADFYGSFRKTFPIDEELYEDKKDAAIKELQASMIENPKENAAKALNNALLFIEDIGLFSIEDRKRFAKGYLGIEYKSYMEKIRTERKKQKSLANQSSS